MTLPIVKPGTFIHSPELDIEVTTYKTINVREQFYASESNPIGICKLCVFAQDNKSCANQRCSDVVWVDRTTYALLRLTR